MMGGSATKMALFCLAAVATVAAVGIRVRTKRRRRAASYGALDVTKPVDIGAIFGLDVGGTLAKLVYFEQTKRSRKVDEVVTKRRFTFFDDPKKGGMKRSRSLENLNTPRHTKALDTFYEFMHSDASPIKPELRDEHLTFYSRVLGGELHFMRFETRFMDRVVDIVKSNRLHHSINNIGCTGGGAFKFGSMFQERLGITLKKMDELECLMRGLEFVLQHVVGECYTYKPDLRSHSARQSPSSLSSPDGDQPPRPGSRAEGRVGPDGGGEQNGLPSLSAIGLGASLISSEVTVRASDSPSIPDNARSPPGPTSRQKGRGQSLGGDKQEWKYKVQRSGEHVIYPYLVVNIGSGVSILKVEAPGKYQRVSGSSLGGGTYWGLCRMLTRCKSFDEVLDLAEVGDAALVDMTVGDIYGGGYDKFHLSPSVIASSFGKLVMKDNPAEGVREEDMARSLLMMITSNIGQVAYLNAVIHRATHIYFVGNFLRHNKISCRRLAFAIDYWSGGKMEALFLEHEGHFGALGAFLSNYGEDLLSSHQQPAGPLKEAAKPRVAVDDGMAHMRKQSYAGKESRSQDALMREQSYSFAGHRGGMC